MEIITYNVVPDKFGLRLLAASEKGLVALFLGDDSDKLLKELKERFPNAQLNKGNLELNESNIVIDERGTSFQKKVWKVLRQIPVGTVVTYSDIANSLGIPKAVRAIGMACGANPIAIITPCHRVVGKNGKLTGYRWGLERKLSLLQLENRILI